MKKFALAIFLVSATAAGAMAQSSIFDRYDVQMTGWAQLPPEAPWGDDGAFSGVVPHAGRAGSSASGGRAWRMNTALQQTTREKCGLGFRVSGRLLYCHSGGMPMKTTATSRICRAVVVPLLIWAAASTSLEAQDNVNPVPPFGIFDNLYYVGLEGVSAYVLTTSDGLILIDALYPDQDGHIFRSVGEMGLDPDRIRYVIVTHAPPRSRGRRRRDSGTDRRAGWHGGR